MTIGTNIKKYRESKKLSQSELAHLVDVSQAVISSWESDHTQPKSLQILKLAQTFDKEVLDLFEGVSTVKYLHNQDNNEHSVNASEVHMGQKNVYEKLISVLEEQNILLNEKCKHLENEFDRFKKSN